MGNKNTRLINNTDEVMEIRVFRGIITGTGKINVIEAHKHTDIDGTKYDGADCRGGQLPSVMIFCDGRIPLRSSKGDLVLPGEEFFSFKTVTIDQVPEDQNSTGVINYEVKFQEPRDASVVSAKSLKGMTLDPSKLFASNIVYDPETSLLNMVLEFWPTTFTDLNRKDDLERTVRVVNDLMHQVKLYNVDRSKVEIAKVVENVRVLKELCTAKVEWYHPLFPGMEDRFPPMAEVDQEKLTRFATTIEPLLRQPNYLPGRSS